MMEIQKVHFFHLSESMYCWLFDLSNIPESFIFILKYLELQTQLFNDTLWPFPNKHTYLAQGIP